MIQSKSRENILKKIRQALTNPVPAPFSGIENSNNIFHRNHLENEVEFAENFTLLQGRFSFCSNEKELVDQLQILTEARKWRKVYCREDGLKDLLRSNGFVNILSSDLADCDVSVTSCEWLISRTGSIVMSSSQQSGRTVSVYAPVHICIAYARQLVYDIKDALLLLKEKYKENFPSMITFATGPSRTADIEKTLVVGVHGPKEVFCFLIDDSNL